jgi:uncharacterized membrane protein
MKTVRLSTVLGLNALLSCADKPTEAEAVADSADVCAEVPVVNYDNFGQGFIGLYCHGCHGSEAEDRHGAPEEVTFGSVDEVWAWSEQILALAANLDDPAMPPGGGVPDDERTKLSWWLTCAPEGT